MDQHMWIKFSEIGIIVLFWTFAKTWFNHIQMR
jgi:hypothetical protein